MPKQPRRSLFVGGLFLFAFWLFVALPFLYGVPRHSQEDRASYKCSTEENKNYGFWEKTSCDPTAYFTLWLVGFTAVLAVSTIGLWGATYLLYRAGERALETTERAFVFIDGFNIELTTAVDSDQVGYELLPERYRSDPGIYVTRFAAQPRWKNGGNTPTKEMTIQVAWRGPLGPIPPDYVYRASPEPFFLAPRATEPSSYIEMPGAQALVNWANNPVGEPPMMWIWGRADYRDVFGKPHFIEWCYQLRLSRPIRKERMTAAFIQWGEYNRSDRS